MRWLILTVDFPPATVGGIAAWAADLAGALAARGEAVTVLARRTGDTRAHDAALPYRVVRMAGRSWLRWQGAWAALHAAAELARRGSRDLVVLAATWRLAWPLFRAPRPAGLRLAIAAHGSDLTRLREAPPAFVEAVRRADALFPVSGFLAGEFRRLGVDDARLRVLPMPLDVPPQPAPGPREGLAMVARLTPLKGADRAVALARALGEPLTVVGDGEAADRVRGVPGVRWLGRRPRAEARAVLAGARAALLLPRPDADGTGAEGLGLALLEAAAVGTPAIGCRTGGVPEATGPGLVLDDPDDAAASAHAAARLLADPGAGRRAHAWVRARHGPEAALRVLDEALG